jgi:pyridoxamine 5'-phosphate oxidase
VTGDLRTWLRSLPPFPPELPEFGAVPDEPVEIFTRWLTEAAALGDPAPHAMTLSTAVDGVVSARVLILKDVTGRGWVFAKSATSPTGRALTANPHAALTFFWPTLGRQVRVEGAVHREPAEVAAADFLARPESSRVSTLVGHQSEVLTAPEDYAAARAAVSPDEVAADWAVWVLMPSSVEFWQASSDRVHTRVRYRPATDGWSRDALWP